MASRVSPLPMALVLAAVIFGFANIHATSAAECQTQASIVQPKHDVAEDNRPYVMINIPGFQQNATSVECLPNQTCEKGTCQQDYKLHQFLSLPQGKQQFEIDDLQLRFFKIPYGCRCAANL